MNEELVQQTVNEEYYYGCDPKYSGSPYPNERRQLEDALTLEGVDLGGTQILHDLEVLQDIREKIEEKGKEVQIWVPDRSDPLNTLLRIFQRYERNSAEQFEAIKRFRDDIVIELSAIRLNVESAQNGATHREKDARLRGLTDLIEQGIRRLRDAHVDSFDWWRWPESVFASDHTEARLQRQVWELEKQIEQYRAAHGDLPADEKQEENYIAF